MTQLSGTLLTNDRVIYFSLLIFCSQMWRKHSSLAYTSLTGGESSSFKSFLSDKADEDTFNLISSGCLSNTVGMRRKPKALSSTCKDCRPQFITPNCSKKTLTLTTSRHSASPSVSTNFMMKHRIILTLSPVCFSCPLFFGEKQIESGTGINLNHSFPIEVCRYTLFGPPLTLVVLFGKTVHSFLKNQFPQKMMPVPHPSWLSPSMNSLCFTSRWILAPLCSFPSGFLPQMLYSQNHAH